MNNGIVITTIVVVVALMMMMAATAAAQTLSNSGSAATTLDWNGIATPPPAATDFNSLSVGSCMCDLTPNICDANCCCDPDCAGATSTFTGCDRPNGGNNQALMCTPETTATSVLRSTEEVLKKKHFGEESTCVVKTNLVDREGLSMFYQLPTQSERDTIQAPTSPWPAPAKPTKGFSVGDALPLLHAKLNGGVPPPVFLRSVEQSEKFFRDYGMSGGGATAVGSGTCDGDAFVGFMQDSETHSCLQSGASLAAVCVGGVLDVAQFRYLAFARPKFDPMVSVSDVVPISLRFVDDDTNALIEATDATPPFQNAFDPNVATTAPVITAATTFNGTHCIRGVAGTRLTVVYNVVDGISAITSASLVVRVAPARAPLANNLYSVSSATRFIRAGSATADLSNDSPLAAESKRVGHPGYVSGSKIRVGLAVTDAGNTKTGIYEVPTGFEVPIAGACSDGRFGSVPFLHNVGASSCTMSLTEAQIQGVCTTGSLQLVQDLLFPASCGGVACPKNGSTLFLDHIGIDGEASSTNINDWVKISGLPLDNPTSAYDTIHHRCSGIITGLHWTLGVARAGPVYNPQDVIVSARVEKITGSWNFAPNPPAGATSTVRFNFKVSFVRLAESGKVFRKPVVPPSLFPAVDEDIFYPFKRPDS